MTPREILIGIAYIGQAIDLGDRDRKAAGIDQASEFLANPVFLSKPTEPPL